MPDQPRPPGAPHAIELMTAWLDSSTGPPDLLVDYLRSHLDEDACPEAHARAMALISGLTYLSGSLLVMLEFETDVAATTILRRLALEYAQDPATD
jgi:hypothetical protein